VILGWYVLLTEPRAEYLAAEELARDGFEVFLPRVKVTETRLGHTDTPLFPGYIFLRSLVEDGGWPTFKKIHRIVKLVAFGEGTPTVPHEVIQELKRRLEEVNDGGGLWRNFRSGDRVKVVTKALELLGEIVEEPKAHRSHTKVLLEFMGRRVPAQVAWENLRPFDGESPPLNPRPRKTRGKGRWIQGNGLRVATAG
jgi:transcriptional antiterminator RfaH